MILYIFKLKNVNYIKLKRFIDKIIKINREDNMKSYCFTYRI